MHDKTLLKISIITSLIGILLLIFVFPILNGYSDSAGDGLSSEKKYSNNQPEDFFKKTHLTGKVEKISNYGNYTFVKLSSSCSYDVFINNDIKLQKGQTLIIYGKPQIYEGKQTFYADRIVNPDAN